MYDYEMEHLRILRPLLAECTVLLRSNGAFPLSRPCPIALYGKGARHTVKGGTGSGDVNSRYYVTVEEGLKQAGFSITTNDWLDAYDNLLLKAKQDFVTQIKARAKAAHKPAMLISMGSVMQEPSYTLPLIGEGDTAVYVLVRQPGEGGDRKAEPGDYLLSECEIRDILALQKQYRQFLLVLNVGGPVDLSPLDTVENILLLSQLGVDTGHALADILLGKEIPSGKLTTTWVSKEEIGTDNLSPIGAFGELNDTEYREGIYVGYRYYDTMGKRTLFPFGHGLSFTTFKKNHIQVSTAGTNIQVTAEITNTGRHPGKEVLQVYLSKPTGKLDQPRQELAAFGKTSSLLPGETELVTAAFDLCSMASYDTQNAAYILEAGDYVIRTGGSVAETVPSAMLQLEETVIVRKVKNLLGNPGFEDWRPAGQITGALHRTDLSNSSDIPIIHIDIQSIKQETVFYNQKRNIEEAVKKMSNRELALLSVGNFGALGGLSIVMGSASSHVSGASGETCGKVKDVPALVMADGPAGLRLHCQFYRDKKGVHGIGNDTITESMQDFMPKWITSMIAKFTPKPKKGQQIEDQYVTAIPIGTAIAQSFHPKVAETCGDIAGAEMERFGVQLWLAPALNIHRNVLCGRNFEYYSEDPLLSGCMAAAITRGVQKHPGCGVTLKHFCANNQERNRYRNNSLVSERALREIYLRGFEICIRTARPKAIMNSYNLLNGIHTSERYDLNTEILRDEFGFEGLIMTDWIIMVRLISEKGSVHKIQTAGLTAAAGTGITMPGSKGDYKDVLKALKNGTLSRKQAEINASYLLRAIKAIRGTVLQSGGRFSD